MIEISDSLRSLFSAQIEERDGSYVVDIPSNEVEHDTLAVDETYRIAVL
ncbi:deoxyribonuclease, partial [Halorubrum sp. SD626R]